MPNVKSALRHCTFPLSFAALAFVSPTLAVAGSASLPGFTTGLAVYAPIPEGLYLINVNAGGIRGGSADTATSLETPFFIYQSPLTFLGATVQFPFAPTLFAYDQKGGPNLLGLYNTFVATQLNWSLAPDLGVGYRLGGYIPMKGEVANNYGVIEHRFGFSYTPNTYNFTANFQIGTPIDSVTVGRSGAPNYFNLDLTATKKFDKLELGVVAFTSGDLSRPAPTYRKQSQTAVGGLIGYNFGSFFAQVKVTTDVVERNYGGRDTRGWLNLVIPLWVNAPPPVVREAVRNRT